MITVHPLARIDYSTQFVGISTNSQSWTGVPSSVKPGELGTPNMKISAASTCLPFDWLAPNSQHRQIFVLKFFKNIG